MKWSGFLLLFMRLHCVIITPRHRSETSIIFFSCFPGGSESVHHSLCGSVMHVCWSRGSQSMVPLRLVLFIVTCSLFRPAVSQLNHTLNLHLLLLICSTFIHSCQWSVLVLCVCLCSCYFWPHPLTVTFKGKEFTVFIRFCLPAPGEFVISSTIIFMLTSLEQGRSENIYVVLLRWHDPT